jgi:hypothetical protein
MSGGVHNFNNIKTQAVINLFFSFFFFVLQFILTETLWEHAPSYATVKKWVASLHMVIFPPVMHLVLDLIVHKYAE